MNLNTNTITVRYTQEPFHCTQHGHTPEKESHMRTFMTISFLLLAITASGADRPCSFYAFAQATNASDGDGTAITRIEAQPTCTVGTMKFFAAVRGDGDAGRIDQLKVTVPVRGWTVTGGKQLITWAYATPPADLKEYVGFQPGSDEGVYQTGVMLTHERKDVDTLRLAVFDADGKLDSADRAAMIRYERPVAGMTLGLSGRTNLDGANHQKAMVDVTYTRGAFTTTLGLSQIWKDDSTGEHWLVATYKVGRFTPFALLQTTDNAREIGVMVDLPYKLRIRVEHARDDAREGHLAVQLQHSIRF